MKKYKSPFDFATEALKNELNAIPNPDFTEIILAKSRSNQLKPHSFGNSNWLAAAIFVIALNTAALWVSWNYNQANEQSTDVVEAIYNENATWDSFLTSVE